MTFQFEALDTKTNRIFYLLFIISMLALELLSNQGQQGLNYLWRAGAKAYLVRKSSHTVKQKWTHEMVPLISPFNCSSHLHGLFLTFFHSLASIPFSPGSFSFWIHMVHEVPFPQVDGKLLWNNLPYYPHNNF